MTVDTMRMWLHLALREMEVRTVNPPDTVHDGGRHAFVAAPRAKGDGVRRASHLTPCRVAHVTLLRAGGQHRGGAGVLDARHSHRAASRP
eukprot:6314968-Pyramimonas_sp.AAC.1